MTASFVCAIVKRVMLLISVELRCRCNTIDAREWRCLLLVCILSLLGNCVRAVVSTALLPATFLDSAGRIGGVEEGEMVRLWIAAVVDTFSNGA